MTLSCLKPKSWDAVAQGLLLLYVAECTFGSSGRWLEIGPLSIRMLLFGLCFLATLPAVLRRIRQLAGNLQVIVTLGFGVYLLVCAGLGLYFGNAKGFIWSDVSSLSALALVPGFMATMGERGAIRRAIDVVYWVSVALAVVTVVLHIVLAFLDNASMVTINQWINRHSLGGLATMQTGIQRIYMKSQMFLQVAVVYGVWKIGLCAGKKRVVLYVAEGLLLCASILSYTRGFWLGLAVSACLLLLTGVRHWMRFVKVLAAMLGVLAVYVAVSTACYGSPAMITEIVNRFDPSLIPQEDVEGNVPVESDPLDESADTQPGDEADEVKKNNMAAVDLRAKTLTLLGVRIGEHPLFGSGLGANLDEIRQDGRTEYMYLDMMMKTGVIGTILFVLTFFSFIVVQIRDSFLRRRRGLAPFGWEGAEMRNRFLTAAYLGVAATSFVNPFLNNPMGIMLLMLTATAVYEARPAAPGEGAPTLPEKGDDLKKEGVTS